jgi:hypothetical protein
MGTGQSLPAGYPPEGTPKHPDPGNSPHPNLVNDAYNKDKDVVVKNIKYESFMRDANRNCLVFITNQSSYALHYKAINSSEGQFFHDVSSQTFRGPKFTIEPGYTGGFLLSKWFGGVHGAWGYVSFSIKTEGKNYVVVFSFGQPSGAARRTRVGLEIRSESGILDAKGNVAGHGVDPTGAVTDTSNVHVFWPYVHSLRDCNAFQKHVEETRCFTATVAFNSPASCTAEFHLDISCSSEKSQS